MKDNGRNNILYIKKIDTPLNDMIIGVTAEGLCLLLFADDIFPKAEIEKVAKELGCKIYLSGKAKENAEWQDTDNAIKQYDISEQQLKAAEKIAQLTEYQLNEYFTGTRIEFTIPLVLVGTEFQKQVWTTLLAIPFGTTISYKQEAIMAGNPKACRAVAQANGANHICIIVPCHRVIGSSKKRVSGKTDNTTTDSNPNIGGYSAGIWRKEFLLNLEKGKLK